MCDRSMNLGNPCNGSRNTYVNPSRENILNNQRNCLGEKNKPFYKSSTTFNVDCNSHFNNPCKSKDKISLHDLTYTQDYLYREPWTSLLQEKSCRECKHKNIIQPVVGVYVARHSQRPSKIRKNRPKRRCRRNNRDTTVPMKRDTSETICGRSTDCNNENFANYLENCTSKDRNRTKRSNLLSKDCFNCGVSPSCSVNVSNNNLEAYADPNDYEVSYESNVASCENCANYSHSSLVKQYLKTQDWSNHENFCRIDSIPNLHGCCCSRNTRENEIRSQNCNPSKSSLFVETGESIIDFSRCSSSYSDIQNICACSNETPTHEESLTMIENIERNRSHDILDRVMFDECKIRCKSREPGAPCCSHSIPKEHCYSCGKAIWNRLETVESKAQRPDYEHRENIQRRNASTSSTIRSIDKSKQCYESRTKCARKDIKKGSEENGIPRDCQSSLFGDFEIGKVWSHIHGACKNLVQSAITNVGQAIKDLSRSKDTLGDCKENEISDSTARNSSFDKLCQGPCGRVYREHQT